jgi:hypothetical protein
VGADAAGRAGAGSAAPPRTPYKLPRISIARPFKTPESSAKTVDGSLPEAASGNVLDEKAVGPQRQKMVRVGDLKDMIPASIRALWFEMRGFATLLTMKSGMAPGVLYPHPEEWPPAAS